MIAFSFKLLSNYFTNEMLTLTTTTTIIFSNSMKCAADNCAVLSSFLLKRLADREHGSGERGTAGNYQEVVEANSHEAVGSGDSSSRR